MRTSGTVGRGHRRNRPAGRARLGGRRRGDLRRHQAPAAWRGTPAEAAVDLDNLDEARVFFEGTARDAAVSYPRNANVVAMLALAGAGFDATRVRLVADPEATGNSHAYRVRSAHADYEMRIDNRASAGNVRTSVATTLSILREIRNRLGPVSI